MQFSMQFFAIFETQLLDRRRRGRWWVTCTPWNANDITVRIVTSDVMLPRNRRRRRCECEREAEESRERLSCRFVRLSSASNFSRVARRCSRCSLWRTAERTSN